MRDGTRAPVPLNRGAKWIKLGNAGSQMELGGTIWRDSAGWTEGWRLG